MDDRGDAHIPGFNGDGLVPLMNNDNHRRRASARWLIVKLCFSLKLESNFTLSGSEYFQLQ